MKPSRTAAIGGTRVARMAGKSPATSVMIVPTSSETTIVRVAKTVSVVGRSSSSALKSSFRPIARPKPAKRPMIEAMIPIVSASTITDQRIWRREAPIVRMVANSRVRCATVIESVLKMTKAPTKSAMPAKASRKYWMKFVNSLISSLSSCASTSAERTCASAGEDRLNLVDQLLRSRSLDAGDGDGVDLAFPVEQLLRGGEVEDGEGRRPEGVDVAELGDPGDLEVLLRLERRDLDRVSDLVVLPVRRARVDHYLAVPLGPRALDEVERVEAVDLGAGLDAEAEAGCALGVDRLAVGADDLRVGLVRDRAGRGLDVRERGDLIDHRLVDGRGLRLDALEADFGALPRDDDVGPRIGLVEDGRERLVDRVREDVGAAHHRDPEDDRERGERRPELAAEQSSESDADHRLLVLQCLERVEPGGAPRGEDGGDDPDDDRGDGEDDDLADGQREVDEVDTPDEQAGEDDPEDDSERRRRSVR